MIMARNGRIRAKTGHDHEAACSPAPGTAPFTPPVALSMIVKAFLPEAGTRSFTIMDEPLRREACVAGESGAAIVATRPEPSAVRAARYSPTSAGVPPVMRRSSAYDVGNTVCGWPPAAQITSYLSSQRSTKVL